MRGGLPTNYTKPIVAEFDVEPGAPFAGREVRELGLPGDVCWCAATLTGMNGFRRRTRAFMRIHI